MMWGRSDSVGRLGEKAFTARLVPMIEYDCVDCSEDAVEDDYDIVLNNFYYYIFLLLYEIA